MFTDESINNGVSQLRFWGVRGSIPTADADKHRIGGNTACVEFSPTDGTQIIFDAGTGIRPLGNLIARSNEKPYEVHLFLSHTHWDHIIGLLFFAPLHQPHAHLIIYGPKRKENSLQGSIEGLFRPPYFPLSPGDLPAKLTYVELEPGRHPFGNGHVLECALHPHPNGAMSYRVEAEGRAVAYITDIEHTVKDLVPATIEISRGVDALIHDSHFHREDLAAHRTWGHSSWEESVAVAVGARAKRLLLFHYSPNYSDDDIFDMEQRARHEFANTTAAFQGLTIDFPRLSPPNG